MEWWWVKWDFYENLDKMHVKLFPNFTSFSFEYTNRYNTWISWVTNYDHNRRFLTCLLSCRELHALKHLENTRFQAPFNALRSSFITHNIWKFRRHLGTETYGTLPWQFCNFTREIIWSKGCGITLPLFDDSSYLLIRSNKIMYFFRFKVATDKEKMFPQMLQWFQWC